MEICPVNPETKWCERHKKYHHGRIYELSQMPNALGEKYRKYWDTLLMKGVPPTITASFNGAGDCGGLVIELEYVPAVNAWVYGCGSEEGLRWLSSTHLATDNLANTYTPDSGQNEPFEWVYSDVKMTVYGCDGTYTVTITL